MPIHDKELEELVKEQTKYFNEGASVEKKMDVFKRIEARQRKLLKGKRDE